MQVGEYAGVDGFFFAVFFGIFSGILRDVVVEEFYKEAGVDICHGGESQHDVEQDHEWKSLCNKDSKQYRCRSDHHHQYGIRKMADGHQNGIAKQIFGSVEELCKYRVDP